MQNPYSTAIENAMRLTYAALNERQRRLYAASEALELGHGGVGCIARLFGCHRKTIQRGSIDLRIGAVPLPVQTARKKGGDGVRAYLCSPDSMTPFGKSSIRTRRATPIAMACFGRIFPVRKSHPNCHDAAFESV